MAIDSTSHSTGVDWVSDARFFKTAVKAAFALTVFSSAFLLFLVQPLIGKFILPWYGGSPSVWTTCMLIFQLLLFCGYAYAHWLSRLSFYRQTTIHLALLLIAICTLPITPSAQWKPTDTDQPAWQIIALLMACVGMPYFLLSATGPLIQSWFARSLPRTSPYRLYALSNLGSLLALVAYPFVIERWWSKPDQTLAWSIGFALFALICCASALFGLVSEKSAPATRDCESESAGKSQRQSALPASMLWFALSAIASISLLATTNQVCLDVAVIPFLWVIPLALYLISFILCFDGDHWYQRWVFIPLAILTLPVAWFFTLLPANGSLLWQLTVYFTALFAVCMICHGELVRLKPDVKHLTRFYLTISAGGSCGGLFAGLLAPMLFVDYYEFPLAILGFSLLLLLVLFREAAFESRVLIRTAGLTAFSIWLLCIGAFASAGGRSSKYLAMARNFYGSLKVEKEISNGSVRTPRQLIHGRIVHGAQNVLSPRRNLEPTAYYGRQSGVGLMISHANQSPERHIGVIGMGIGTVAAYGRPGDRYRFYEINPTVVEFANAYFTFLARCPASKTCAIGDARLILERETPQNFDVLVLDAFSGDAIPVHLLTREAFEVYLRHLAPQGALACHISNVHFDLRPVLAGIADDFQLATLQIDSAGQPSAFQTDATWIILARKPDQLPAVPGSTLDQVRRIHWTDDQNNLFDVLIR